LRGFSLGEVILSVAVLTVGILPILGAMTGALRTTFDAESEIVATGLAQEGVELVMNVRDNALACKASSGEPDCASYTGFEKFPGDRKYCRIDYNDDNVFRYDSVARRGVLIESSSNCRADNDPASNADRYFDLKPNANDFYQNSGGTEGKFKRQLVFDYDGASAYTVYSIVYWGNSPLPNNAADTVATVIASLSSCTLANQCLYVKVKLSAWK